MFNNPETLTAILSFACEKLTNLSDNYIGNTEVRGTSLLRSPLGLGKSDLISQVTISAELISYNLLYTEQIWDCLLVTLIARWLHYWVDNNARYNCIMDDSWFNTKLCITVNTTVYVRDCAGKLTTYLFLCTLTGFLPLPAPWAVLSFPPAPHSLRLPCLPGWHSLSTAGSPPSPTRTKTRQRGWVEHQM